MTDAPLALAAACPGQGVDPRDVAAVLDAHPDHPLVARLAAHTGRRRWDDADLGDTRLAQPAVVAASVVAATTAGHHWQAAVGHSLGELAAAVIAGAVDAADAVDLAVERARLGYAADQERPGRMAVVMRLADHQIEWVRRTALTRVGGVVEVAVVNGPGQVVLSGDVDSVDAAMAVTAEIGGVARRLPIGGAFHTPLLGLAVAPFAAALAAVCRAPRRPLVSCTQARVLVTATDVIEGLSRSLVLPVRWEAAVAATVAAGVDHLVDVGPGRTLTNLATHVPTLVTVALDDTPPLGTGSAAPRLG